MIVFEKKEKTILKPYKTKEKNNEVRETVREIKEMNDKRKELFVIYNNLYT